MKLKLPWKKKAFVVDVFEGFDKLTPKEKIPWIEQMIAAGDSLKIQLDKESRSTSYLYSRYDTDRDVEVKEKMAYQQWVNETSDYLQKMFTTPKHAGRFASASSTTTKGVRVSIMGTQTFKVKRLKKDIDLKIDYLEKVIGELKKEPEPKKKKRFGWTKHPMVVSVVSIVLTAIVTTVINNWGTVYPQIKNILNFLP